MIAASKLSWHDANQQYLVQALKPIRAALTGRDGERSIERPAATSRRRRGSRRSAKTQPALDSPSALERLCAAFGLSSFERAVLLMCAGVELDAGFADIVAQAHGDPHRTAPTFGLALAALPEAHWSAIVPAAPLRRWRLVEIGPGQTIPTSPLRVDERILHYLTGVSYLDERFRGLVEYVAAQGDLPDSHRAHVDSIVAAWTTNDSKPLPIVHLNSEDSVAHRVVAEVACRQLGLRLFTTTSRTITRSASDLDTFRQLWAREALLGESALFIDLGDTPSDPSDDPALESVLDHVQGCFVLSSRTRRVALRRRTLIVEMTPPTSQEQRAIWRQSLGRAGADLNGQLDAIVSQFNLGAASIDRACWDAFDRVRQGLELEPALWRACRALQRRDMDDLATRIVPSARWDDLVLADAQKQILRQIAVHVRQRVTVYADWGFAARTSRGLGISALFSGPSGTGKTMAGEVLANELNLDLYHVDLSQVVSKYIGETEKNLRRVFDGAEHSGAILLFDEADALFGKRSDVKDSHDRYANVEISYLLQRMESYRGLAILTTNMKGALDPAFTRRIRFVVQFPFPDAAQRFEIWRKAFPRETPTRGLDCERLARLAVTGGNIRNIALNAAFLAADAREPVKMTHLFQAAQAECAKLERPLTEAEVGGWR
jgi:AAA+ superfamily predicted ATPase